MESGSSVHPIEPENKSIEQLKLKNEKYPKNLTSIRKNEFRRLKGHVYLDFTGSSVYSTRLLNDYRKDLNRNLYGNPHSANPSSNLMSKEVDNIRELVLQFFNVTSQDYSVIFTSGATASLRLLAECFQWSKSSMYAYLEDNHTSVVGIRETAATRGARSFCLRFPKGESLDVSNIKKWIPSAISELPLDKVIDELNSEPTKTQNLFAYPAQSNFSGRKYPLSWISEIKRYGFLSLEADNWSQSSNWSVVLDAAAYVPTSPLDLRAYPAEFVCMSFYKVFGFPTGIGALLVKRTMKLVKDSFFGGGTTEVYLPSENFSVLKQKVHERHEEGTIGFLNILALKYGFDTLKRTAVSMKHIQLHTFSLIKLLHHQMVSMRHKNGEVVFEVYTHSNYEIPEEQGAVVTFNVMRDDGSYVGYNEVIDLASKKEFHLRGGCFCNVGSCNTLLSIGDDRIKQIHKAGFKCGGIDLIDGLPVGAVRASLGHISTSRDVKKFLRFLRKTFLNRTNKNIILRS